MTNSPIIDVDIHHDWGSPAVLAEYLAPEWREYFLGGAPGAPSVTGRMHPPHILFPAIGGSLGGHAAPHYEVMREEHLDPHGITRGLLTWGYGVHPGLHHAAASVALCRAANDFMVDYWYGTGDRRLRGTIYVPVGVPEEAVAEIRRLGPHPQTAGVLVAVNPFHKPLGHPVYHPIYAAALEYDLPIVTHLGSDQITNGSSTAGGLPTTMVEQYINCIQPGMHHLTSFVTEGVFEKFPSLRLLINEYGFDWVPWVLWGLDSRYQTLRRENPRLRRRPSEYFFEHVWLSAQPFVSEASPSRVVELLESFEGFENKLCYASDYPHWDNEWPQHVRPRLPRPWRSKVMCENAARLFGWSMAELEAEAAAAAERERLLA